MKPIKTLMYSNKMLTVWEIYELIKSCVAVKIEFRIIEPHRYIRTMRMEIYKQIEENIK